MQLGLGLLRLGPDDFWRMTPRELERALSLLAPAGEAPARAELATLMARFPDRGHEEKGESAWPRR